MFPYKMNAYQKKFAEKVQETLKQRGNIACLSSETGSGKTLSLLATVCNWMLKNNQASPRVQVVYLSRTHNQLENVVNEFRKLTEYYKSQISILAFGSTQQMGGHGPKENCHLRHKRYGEIFLKQQYEALTQKEVVSILKDLDECPYCYTRAFINKVDILLVPYNYVLVDDIRRNVGLVIRNKILIFDEAHNIEKVAEDALSASLKITEIEKVHKEVKSELHKEGALIIERICRKLILM